MVMILILAILLRQVFKIIEDMGTYTTTQLYNKINELSTQKEALRQVILSKGADVSTNDLLDDYPSIIDGICGHPDIRLEYLQADETPNSLARTSIYFDTGVVPEITSTSNTNFEICFKSTYSFNGTSDALYNLLGARSSAEMVLAVPCRLSSTNYGGRVNFAGSQNMLPGPDTNIHRLQTFAQANSVTVYYDGNKITRTATVYTSLSHSFYIFASNNNGTAVNKAIKGTQVYYLKIWNNTVLLRDYIPVLHWNGSQYVACFYDRVNNNYIYNLGTGTLVYKIR